MGLWGTITRERGPASKHVWLPLMRRKTAKKGRLVIPVRKRPSGSQPGSEAKGQRVYLGRLFQGGEKRALKVTRMTGGKKGNILTNSQKSIKRQSKKRGGLRKKYTMRYPPKEATIGKGGMGGNRYVTSR